MTHPNGEPINDEPDPYLTFMRCLPNNVASKVNRTQRLAGLVTRAVLRGWTVDQLVHEAVKSPGGIENYGGAITRRMEFCADHDPTATTVGKPAHRSFCTEECKTNNGFILDLETFQPVARCPCGTAA